MAPQHIMDQWLLSTLSTLTQAVTRAYQNYDLTKASRLLIEFVNQLSTWYLRLSRDRLRADDNQEPGQVLGFALLTLSKLFAPLCPFFSEIVYQALTQSENSVHLTDWPEEKSEARSQELEDEMTIIQQIVEKGHAERKAQNLKVRQPLASISVNGQKLTLSDQLSPIICQELNVKQVIWQEGQELSVKLDTKLTPELIAEGEAREIARTIQNLRKKSGLKPNQSTQVKLENWPEAWTDWIEQKTHSTLAKAACDITLSP